MGTENMYKVLSGDPFGGYDIIESELTKEAADKLALELQKYCDYFTTIIVKPMEDTTWG